MTKSTQLKIGKTMTKSFAIAVSQLLIEIGNAIRDSVEE